MAWAMRCTRFPTRVRTRLSTLWKVLQRKKGREDEYQLYAKVEKIAIDVIAKKRKIYKGVSANVDFYSGFVYSMLNLPLELYTPILQLQGLSAGVRTEWRN